MKTLVTLFLLFNLAMKVNATQQESDKLIYDNISLSLNTGWGHPSPLETYFYQNRITYPFESISTANYRGHIATWIIQNSRFYLKEIDVEEKKYLPSKYGIKSKNNLQDISGLTFADWFSGMLVCERKDPKDHWKTVSTYIVQVRNGEVISIGELTQKDDRNINNISEVNLTATQKLVLLYQNYVAYYFRLNENDAIEYNNRSCRLSTSFARIGPIYGLYSNQHLNWPYNWENLEKSGAPHCSWKIRNDSLMLTSMQLYRGTRFDSIDKETIALDSLFPGRTINQEVFADWVTGIQLVVYGNDTIYGLGFKEFRPKEYTYCRLENGIIKELYTIPFNFDMKKNEDNLDPKLKKLMKDF